MSQTFLNSWHNDTNPISPYTQTTQGMGFGIPQQQGMNINFGSPQGVQSQEGGLMGIMPNQPTASHLGGMEQMAQNTPGNLGGEGTSFFGKDGWGNLALGGLQTGFGIYGGLKQLDMAKDQLDFQKRAFNKNYENQKQRTNTQLRDRQKRRAYERPGYYQSVDEYMNKNGVK